MQVIPAGRRLGVLARRDGVWTCCRTQDNITAGVVMLRALGRSTDRTEHAGRGVLPGPRRAAAARDVQRHQGCTSATSWPCARPCDDGRTVTVAVPGTTYTRAVSSTGDALIGRTLDGRYRVLRRIADGGMATVYLGVDERLDREVALKVMRPHLVHDESFVTRFRREARSAASLSHPNVVAVYDQGEDDGTVFLAMEYVPGLTLREVLHEEGPLSPRAALDVLEPVLLALAEAHAKGLIHRDVKPENVIINDNGTVKVADFGLARAVSSQTVTSTSGLLLGTVAYLSPEQVERGVADARSDVYAAGLVLFEMLTGTKAFTGETPIHVAYQHVHGGVPVPSSRVPGLPPALDDLVAVATARDPDERPTDAADFLDLVRRTRATLSPAALDARPAGAAAAAAASVPTSTAAFPVRSTPAADAAAAAGAAGAAGRWASPPGRARTTRPP